MTPAERHMGDVARILYVHVPRAWNSLLAYTFAFVFAVASLWTRRAKWDHLMVGSIEIGLVLNALLLVQGMLFAKPTWGIWWTWGDVAAGVLVPALPALRRRPRAARLRRRPGAARRLDRDRHHRRLRRRAAGLLLRALVADAAPDAVDAGDDVGPFKLPMRINAFAILFLACWFIARRAEVERLRQATEEAPEPARIPVAGRHVET